MKFYPTFKSLLLTRLAILCLMLSQTLEAQESTVEAEESTLKTEESTNYFGLSFSIGKNAPAFSDDENLDEFLIGTWGNQMGFSMNYLWHKSRFIYDVSLGFEAFSNGLNLPNLDYEFNYPEELANSKAYTRRQGLSVQLFRLETTAYKTVFKSPNQNARVLVGLGFGMALDPSFVKLVFSFSDYDDPSAFPKEYFGYATTPRNNKLNPTFSLKTKAILFETKKMALSLQLAYDIGPFLNYPFNYSIYSKDGRKSGEFYQKFNRFALSVGFHF